MAKTGFFMTEGDLASSSAAATPRAATTPFPITPLVQRPPASGIPASSAAFTPSHSIHKPTSVFADRAAEAAAASPLLGGTHGARTTAAASTKVASSAPLSPASAAVSAAQMALAATAHSGAAMSAATLATLSAQLKSASLQERLLRMKETDAKLEETKRKFSSAMEVIKGGQEQFRVKQREMRDTISQFERFVIEQDNKIVKAEKLAEQEAKVVAQHRATIATLIRSIADRRAEKRRVELELRRLARNRQYLVSVVREMAPDDPSEDDPSRIISRHSLLLGEQTNLEARSTQLGNELEALQVEFAAFKKAKMNEILVGNSELAMQTKVLETTVARAADVEAELKVKHAKSSSTASKIALLEMAIRNVYARVMDSYGRDRRLRACEPDESIENAEARAHDWTRRVLAHCTERYTELDDMLRAWHKQGGARAPLSPAAAGVGPASPSAGGGFGSDAGGKRRSGVGGGEHDLDASALQMNLKSLSSTQMRLSVSGPPSVASSAHPSARK